MTTTLRMKMKKNSSRGDVAETIRYATGESRLGRVLVAASDDGICAIMVGDRSTAMLDDLQRQFPRSELTKAGAEFDSTLNHVLEFINDPTVEFDLPLDLRGTRFQKRVWEALRQIPAGTTTSYAEIARRIGRPKAFRAVAQACAANPIGVAVPCHRVIRSDGSMSGYAGGVHIKRELLAMERGAD